MGARINTAAIAAITLAAMTVPAQTASAQDSYQTELTAGYTWFEADTSPDIEMTEVSLEGTYNFQPVSLKGHPWDQAAFLEHSMQAMVRLSYDDFEVGSTSSDGILYGAGYRYATKDSPVAGEIRFQTGTLDGSLVDVDLTFFDASLGYWVMPNAIAGLAVTYEELDPDGGFKVEDTTVAAFGKLVHELDEGRAINAEARLGWVSVDTGTSDDDNIEIGLAGDYYFTPQYSAGATLDFSFGDAASDEGTTFGIRGSAWFTQQFGVRLEYSKFWASDSLGDDENELGFFLSARF